MSINSMIGNGLSPQYDLSLQGVTNHAMDLPLEEIETPQFDANKLLGVQPQITAPQNLQLSNHVQKQMSKAANKLLRQQIVGNVLGQSPQNIGDVFTALKGSGDAFGQISNAIFGGGYNTSFGPTKTNVKNEERNWFLTGNKQIHEGKDGMKISKQDNFDLNLGRFYRNTLEGPNYMNLESYDENIKDAKQLANKLIDKTPKNSNIPIMQYFIQYKDQPNFKNDYLSLFK